MGFRRLDTTSLLDVMKTLHAFYQNYLKNQLKMALWLYFDMNEPLFIYKTFFKCNDNKLV